MNGYRKYKSFLCYRGEMNYGRMVLNEGWFYGLMPLFFSVLDIREGGPRVDRGNHPRGRGENRPCGCTVAVKSVPVVARLR